jgi:hypothetical protein
MPVAINSRFFGRRRQGGNADPSRSKSKRSRTFFDQTASVGLIARLDRAIQYSRSWLLDRPVKPDDDNEVGVSNEIG